MTDKVSPAALYAQACREAESGLPGTVACDALYAWLMQNAEAPEVAGWKPLVKPVRAHNKRLRNRVQDVNDFIEVAHATQK